MYYFAGGIFARSVHYVKRVSEYDWVDMEWYCLPQGQELWVLGRREYVLLWSKMREAEGRLYRPFPENSIRAEHFGLDPAEAIPKSIDAFALLAAEDDLALLDGRALSDIGSGILGGVYSEEVEV